MTVIAAPVNTPEAWSERALLASPWLAAGWSKKGMRERHLAVIDALRPAPGESMLDFGCGTGELSELVAATVDYTGYDWAAGMVERARHDHPIRTFRTWLPSGRFDTVACIGCFNLADGWSKQRTWHTIRHLWDQTSCRAIAVSLYAGDDVNCLSYKGSEAAKCGDSLSSKVSVDEIRHNDILLVVSR